MIPIVLVLVYMLEKYIQHIINKRNTFLSSEATYGKKTHLKQKKNVASGTFFIGLS